MLHGYSGRSKEVIGSAGIQKGKTMKMPAELIPLYLGAIGNKAFAQNNGSPPVQASSASRSALHDALPKQRQAPRKVDNAGEEKGDHLEPQRGRRKIDEPGSSDGPLPNDRRKASQPVVLDTRVTRSRRKADLRSAINFKI
jgi:hypothetical protein